MDTMVKECVKCNKEKDCLYLKEGLMCNDCYDEVDISITYMTQSQVRIPGWVADLDEEKIKKYILDENIDLDILFDEIETISF